MENFEDEKKGDGNMFLRYSETTILQMILYNFFTCKWKYIKQWGYKVNEGMF